MSEIKLAILGPPVAGKHTSFRRFVGLSRPTGRKALPMSLAWKASIVWPTLKGELTITFTTKVRSNWIQFPDVPEALEDPLARQELLALSQADGIIFVVDSQRERLPANIEFLSQATRELLYFDREPAQIPFIFQLNKQDCPSAMTKDELKGFLSWPVCDYVETVASTGRGIEEVVEKMLALLQGRAA